MTAMPMAMPDLTALITPLSLLLLGLALLNGVALLRPESLLSRAVGAALLLPLLALLALPLPGALLGPLLRGAIPGLVLLILLGLLRPQGGFARAPSAGSAQSPAGWERDRTAQSGWTYVLTALVASLAIGLLLALRPYPFEYPGDSGDYLQSFLQGQLDPSPARSCLVEGWRQPTYQRFCTIWSVVLQAGHLSPATLLSGWPQRLTIGLEVSVLGLSLFRLLQAAGVGAAAAALSWLLVAFGLGNQAIAFLVNHALQGSILAAAVFLEAVMVMLRLLLWRTTAARQAGVLVASLLVFLLLTMKLHGAFALCTLALLVPLLALIGLVRLQGPRQQSEALGSISRPSARWLLLASLGLLALVLSVKTGWLINKQSRFIIPWSFLGNLGIPSQALPASYLMRSPGSRPETLAVVSILIGLGQLAGLGRRLPEGPGDPGHGQRGGGEQAAGAEPTLYALVSSLYGVSILVAFLLPPFSHLFINLPYEVISNYRLMWGCILFSPLPCLIDRALSQRPHPWPARLVTLLTTLLVLVPISSPHERRTQTFWSKSRHLIGGPSPRVDLQAVARALMPSILEVKAEQGGGPVVVLADELIGSALAGYSQLVTPIHATRISNHQALENWETHGLLRKAHSDSERLEVLKQLKQQPTLLIQETLIQPYSSPYAEIRVYDADLAQAISSSGVNQLSAALLEQAGFRSWRWLNQAGEPIRLPETAVEARTNQTPRRATYHVWRRMP